MKLDAAEAVQVGYRSHPIVRLIRLVRLRFGRRGRIAMIDRHNQIVGTLKRMAEYKPWYERFPERFAEEKAEMEARGFVLDGQALARHSVVFRGYSKADPSRELRIECSDAFPSIAPRVVSEVTDNLLIAHQRPDTGEICTFGQRQVRWSAQLSATAAVDEAEEVIRSFRVGGVTPTEEQPPEPATDHFHYSPNLFFLVPPSLNKFPDEVPKRAIVGTFRLMFQPNEQAPRGVGAGRGVLIKTDGRDGAFDVAKHFRKLLRGAQEKKGTHVILPQPPPCVNSPEQLRAWLRAIDVPRTEWMAFVFPDGDASGRLYWSWLIVQTRSDYTFHLGRAFVLSSVEQNVRVPGTAGLSEKTVVMIGCGNLGSKIAAGLAATGLSKFFLVDRDFLEPGNAVRHEGGFTQFGLYKVQVVAGRIYDLNFDTFDNVQLSAFQIGGSVNKEEQKKLFDEIAVADLVIDAAGTHGVSHFINGLCHELNVPSLYASVTNGAWGGEIVRVIPGKTACWMCWVKQYENEHPAFELEPEIGIFAPGCNQPTFTGTTYETGMVANLAAWMAVETLLAGTAGRQNFKGDYLRWTGRSKDGVPIASTETLQIRRAEDCALCQESRYIAMSS